MKIDCIHGTLKNIGKRQWIQCDITNKACMFQRYCIEKRKVVFSTNATQCKLRNNE